MNPEPSDADDALAVCSREPIQIPGAIQPFGVLLVFPGDGGNCIQASANCRDLLPWTADGILGKSLGEVFGEAAEPLAAVAALADPAMGSPLMIDLPERCLEVSLHRHEGALIIELEPFSGDADPSRNFRRLQTAHHALRNVPDQSALHELIGRQVAELTGYERVMVYRFDPDWNGEVVGECLLAPVESYMGHHFPATDIPEQARALYTRNWLRVIPDAGYAPVPLVPVLNPSTGRPLDLGKSMLRSVSPIHLEYLRNVDVGASMSISLIVENQLWGLIACHHRAPRPLSAGLRGACELYGQLASAQIEAMATAAKLDLRIRAARIQTAFFDVIAEELNFLDALVKSTPALLQFMKADGAAIVSHDQITLLGSTPGKEQTRELLGWLRGRPIEPVFVTDSLGPLFPPALEWAEVASGLLALRLSQVAEDYVLWFRPEVVTTLTWAGDPEEKIQEGMTLHPRKSFAAWKQTVTGRSLPWQEDEINGAFELRNAANAMLLRRIRELNRLNQELEEKNTDLNSFAFIASHDLREPLRGISHYASFILEDHRPELPQEAVRRLEMIGTLASQAEELLDALNRFSQLGRMEIQRRDISLETVLDQALDSLSAFVKENEAEVVIHRPLADFSCDPILIREVLSNLIVNGIRYNEGERKRVEVGVLPPEVSRHGTGKIIFVRDNGIGIPEKHFENVFRIFRRLHPPGKFGEGSGAGLAIVKCIVERHGGSIWIESLRGTGTTFYFTLG